MLLQRAALLAALLMLAAAVFGIRTVPVYAENAGDAASEDAGDAASEDAGYMTVSCEWDDPVPEGKGAVILVISGEVPSIGTEEPLHKDTRTLYNPKYDRGTAFMLKDGAFVPAEAERIMNDEYPYTEKPDLSIRAYTQKR